MTSKTKIRFNPNPYGKKHKNIASGTETTIEKIKTHMFILCIVLKEGKGSRWIWIKDSKDKFSMDGHTYFIIDEGTYLKGILRFMVFLEGVSTPFHHGYIERETVKRKYIDRDTQEEKTIDVDKIKGLKFDSKLIDMLLNRNLADVFTRSHIDLPNLLIIILLILTTGLSFVNIGLWFI